jgi:Domain of unknown function (DUF5655)
MARWTCPRCDREFGRTHQSHTCVPGGTVEETFAGYPESYVDAFNAILAHLSKLGPVHVDAVGVGVFLKSDRKLAEIRPMARGLAVWLMLSRSIPSPRITRTLRASVDRTASVIRIQGPSDVDDELRGWLTEAYDEATD